MTTPASSDIESPYMDPAEDDESRSEAKKPSRLTAWLDEHIGKETRELLAKWGQRLLLAGVFAFLIYQLSLTGWSRILADIPTQPMFYIIFVGMYLGLPIAETLIYHLIWGLPYREIFPMMIKKRVYNRDVVNYSGEANLFVWARNRLDRSGRLILRDIKDNTVISSLTSMLIAFSLLSIFLFTGILPLEELMSRVETGWIIGGGFCLVLLIALAVRFRKSVIAFPGKLIRKLFGIHVGRLIFVQALQVCQWMVVMPEVPIASWFTVLAVQIIANQIPLIPSKDLLVVAAGAELASWINVSASGVQSMLLVTAMMDKVVNFLLFSYISIRER